MVASVDYRGLASFCREYEHHCRMSNSDQSPTRGSHHRPRKHTSPPPPASCPSLCHQSSAAAVDILVLFLVLAASGILLKPYLAYACREAGEILPLTFAFIGEIVYDAPVAYAVGVLLTSVAVIGGWEIYQHQLRKCRNPHCRGLRKAVEFDIQLETEECVKAQDPLEPPPWNRGVELTQDQKELEAELKRIAPPNGRAVLVYRAPCGCPAARFEVWAPKKPRRVKK